ncbi:MAG: HD-GYP domain-containing protein [Candidatus Omnitrophica bacterium]|nr:HD-GYP domain-containing protein [Candidatus Omnitrophota bacterium]MBU4479491.1 HD-GYP domain-containing protein [Candidatus Omnitrophota bacterium]MCG2703709.1 HD-GYP domain-containing protein [Candidatus Omnitrophota bacterium]
MKLFWNLLSIIIFFVGLFVGYGLRKKEEKRKSKLVWSRFERRNIMRTINALVAAIDFKDHLTKSHSDNVKHYACAIAREMKLPPAEIERIKEACQVHDLGKIGVHDNILTKPGKLTPEEIKEMRLHSLAGAVILKPFPFLEKIVEIVRQHHERYDGQGYPDGIKGEKICMGARIMAVADSFDAMTSKRPYRQPMNMAAAIEELKNNSGTQFDPKVAEVFIRLLEREPELLKSVER